MHENNRLSTSDIQEVSLQIMKKLHLFLCDHNLRYSLYGGTLIGAIRSEGFIPWDDDLDIAMPQPDYERFLTEWEDTDELCLFAPEKGNSNLLYARICDRNKTQSFERIPWRKGESGVWIDIFPVNAVPTSIEKHRKHIKRMQKLGTKAYLMRYNDVRPSMFSSYRDKILAVYKMFAFRMINCEKIKRIAHKYAFDTYDWEQSEYVGVVTFLDYPDCEHLPKECWEHFELSKFEDTHFYVVSAYDYVLKNYYGDYMELPPEEERVPMHANGQWFCWK